jgi:hypothetical protein
MPIMKPTNDLIDDIYLEKVLRARTLPMAEKILDGPRLYAYACEAVRAGVQSQNPEATPEELKLLVQKRFELIRQLENARG